MGQRSDDPSSTRRSEFIKTIAPITRRRATNCPCAFVGAEDGTFRPAHRNMKSAAGGIRAPVDQKTASVQPVFAGMPAAIRPFLLDEAKQKQLRKNLKP